MRTRLFSWNNKWNNKIDNILLSANFLYAAIIFVFLFSLPTSGFSQFSQDSTKKINLAAIPIVNYDRSLSLNLGAMASVFYKLNATDTISPSSSTGLIGMYTLNNTYFAFAFQKLYLNEDKWRVKFGIGTFKIFFQYYEDIPPLGGMFIDYNTEFNFVFLEAQRMTFNSLYLGLHSLVGEIRTEFDITDPITGDNKVEESSLNNIGYSIMYDTRDNVVNPYKGTNLLFKHSFFRDRIGSSYRFDKYDITYDNYFTIKKTNQILATRLSAIISSGDVPFEWQNTVNRSLRGYTQGKHRANQVYALEAEYRWNFYKKWGIVGFGGVATAVDKINQVPSSELLPALGVGLRFLMISSERVNIGIDIAKGKDDWGIYFRIGEVFSR